MLNAKFTGKTRIFRKDKDGKNGSYPTYSTTVSKKNMDGEYENAWLEVHFKRGVELQNKTDIVLKDAWLTFRQYENKNGYTQSVFGIFVNDFESEAPEGFEDVAKDMPF